MYNSTTGDDWYQHTNGLNDLPWAILGKMNEFVMNGKVYFFVQRVHLSQGFGTVGWTLHL